MKETLMKGALPFLLGVVVTLGVSALTSPCCKDVMEQQKNEIVETKKIVQALKNDVVRYKKAVEKLFKEVHPEAPKAVATAKTTAPAKTAPTQPTVKK